MPKIQWRDEFSVDHDEIDAQHKTWVEILNTAHDRMMNKSGEDLSSLGRDAITQMIEYADMHFEFEEKYMEEMGYTELAEHRQIHDFFKMKLKRIKDDYDNGVKQLNSEVIKMISNWLMDHILKEDQKYKLYSNSI